MLGMPYHCLVNPIACIVIHLLYSFITIDDIEEKTWHTIQLRSFLCITCYSNLAFNIISVLIFSQPKPNANNIIILTVGIADLEIGYKLHFSINHLGSSCFVA